MNIKSFCSLGAMTLLLTLTIRPTVAAEYVPVGPQPTPGRGPASVEAAPSPSIFGNIISKAFGSRQSVVEVRVPNPDNKPITFPKCAAPPTIAEIGGNFDTYRYTMSRSAAAKLNIVGGMGSSESSGEEMIAVFEFSRSKECLATDGKTRMVYGQAIRTVMSFASAEGKISVSFPVVAASATMAGKTSTVSVKNIGFDDPAMRLKAVAMSSINLDVGTYAEFSKLHRELIDLAAAAAIPVTVELLGIISVLEEDEYKSTLLSAYAIQAIKDGKSCADAKTKLKSPDDTVALKVIDSTYVAIAGVCSGTSPTSASITKAQEYLRGMTVKR
ncbi:hypothetical protein [Massilia rubra]|uniref:Uncharacterized protein n=1 Tax=Massilia rubra TaxID=2607910 RepID=A0ABX0LP80_9BURK|nr:hypothetical protein [Massilia rubra]NHZ36701.1 hypothetical protein [Massilia rubra]